MIKKITILGTLLLASNAAVAAQDNPFYAGARAGATYYNELDHNGAKGIDDNDMAAGVFLGYNINDWFGLETGYTYLGEMEIADNLNITTNAIELVGKFTGEVTETINVFAKAGAFAYRAEGNDTLSGLSDSDIDLTVGVGIEKYFTDNFSVRLEYQFYNNITLNDASNSTEFDAHLLALGLIYSWGGQEAVAVTEAPMTEVIEEVIIEEAVVVAPVVLKAIEVEPKTVEVYFDFNKQNLTEKSISDLQPIIAHLQEYPTSKLVLVGHADSIGAAESNQVLSEKRAETVSNYLQEKYSISADRIVTSGEGEANPIATNMDKAGRAQNRRVSVFSPSFTMK